MNPVSKKWDGGPWYLLHASGAMPDSQQIRLAKLLLHVWPTLEKEEFCRRAAAIRASDPVLGPLALAWMFHGAAQRLPPGPIRRYYLEQMDTATEDAVAMRKIRKGWGSFGMTPWEVVHHRRPPGMARYGSEPALGQNAA